MNPLPEIQEFTVQTPDAEAMTLLVAVVRKLGHDVNNALVSAVSLCELAVLDDPACEPALQPVRSQLSKPREVFDSAMRTLPSRSTVRPRDPDDWRVRAGQEANAAQCLMDVDWPLPQPPVLTPMDWAQCLDNVVRNALESILMGRRLGFVPPLSLIRVSGVTRQGWQGVSISDDGPGCTDLAAATSGKTRRAGGGHLGLGLAVCALHMASIGGTVTLSTPPEGGLRTVLLWPANHGA